MRSNTINLKSFLLSLALLIIAVEVLMIMNIVKVGKREKNTGLDVYAEYIIEKCKEEGYRPGCYDSEIPQLMDAISMREAFDVAQIIQSSDNSYGYCHALGHKLAERSVEKDPSQWKEVFRSCPRGLCSDGCLHGVLQARFGEGGYLMGKEIEESLSEFKSLCNLSELWSPTYFELTSCFHAVGHLTVYMSEGEIRKALDLCDDFATEEDGRQVCYEGVFMQVFQPSEPEDIALLKGKYYTAQNVREFCGGFDFMRKAACHNESWPFFIDEILSSPDNAILYCEEVEQLYRNRCFNGLFNIIFSRFNFDFKKIFDYCKRIGDSRRPQCFANAASRMIEVDPSDIKRAVDLCLEAAEWDSEGECMEEIIRYSDYYFIPGSKEADNICEALPFDWRLKCLIKN